MKPSSLPANATNAIKQRYERLSWFYDRSTSTCTSGAGMSMYFIRQLIGRSLVLTFSAFRHMLIAYAENEEFDMQIERHVRLFRNGRNQAIRIPREFELEGKEAVIRKEGHRLIIEPVGKGNRLIELLKRLKPIDEPFPEIEDPPATDDDIF